MFAMILRTQWSWTRAAVGGFALLAFFFPALAWRGFADTGRSGDVGSVMEAFAALGPMLGFLAVLGPFVLAALPWTIDHETKHVYALSLPVTWARFVWMRFAAGAATLILPSLALYIGCRAVLSMLELPPLLRAYPGALSLRFLFACLVAYGATFALQYLAGRRAAVVALVSLLSLGLVGVVMAMLGFGEGVTAIGNFLFDWPGPLAIFVEPWTLIDV
jgi:hypothetical protein